MKKVYLFLKNTIVGGVFLLLPLLVIIILFQKAHHLLTPVGKTLSQKFGIDHFMGFTLIMAVLIIAVCFLLGLSLRLSGVTRFSRWLENSLFRFFPGYEYMKRILQEQLQQEDEQPNQQAVMVRLDDSWYPGMLVEDTGDGRCTVYLPGAPQAASGQVCVVEEERLIRLNCGIKDLFRMQRGFGKGLAQQIAKVYPKETG
jgi:uncharacterized membrane protein